MNDKATATASASGIGVTGLLGVAFVILKLTGHIGWSWAWVTAPFWAPWVVVVLVVGWLAYMDAR